MKRVLLLGRYPPPFGGNSVHIQRLASRLTQAGWTVTVFDLYRRFDALDTVSDRNSVRVIGVNKEGFSALPGILRMIAREATGSVVHFHISAGASFYRVAPVLLWATRSADKRVLTIHSGSWVEEFRKLSGVWRYSAIRVLGAFDDIICVNSEQRDEIAKLLRVRLHVIPAYLPPADLIGDESLPPGLDEATKRVDCLLVTSGYGTSTYDYMTVFQAVELAQERLRVKLGLVAATYSVWDSEYWAMVLERASASSVPITCVYNLTPDQFIQVLRRARIYIRATMADGDAVAIREAAYCGAQVLASDAVSRPSGTAVFKSGDPSDLANAIVNATNDPSFAKLGEDAFADNFATVVRVYDPALVLSPT